MSALDTPPPPSSASAAWVTVGDHLEAFAVAWAGPADPPDPKRFLPPDPPGLRRLVLIELLKLDLDYRLQRGHPKRVEEYAAEFPDDLVAAAGPPCDLLYEEFHLRRLAGEGPDPADYYRRFPGRAAELARLIGDGTARPQSTSVRAARAPVGIAPGDTLDDFDLLALLGEGQFAKVFLARQKAMQRLVALKVSHSRGAEAETLAQLDHPHVVRVYDQRFLPDRGLLLVYMPYLPGGTLHDVLDRVRAVPASERSGKTLLAAVDAALERRGELPPAASGARRLWAERTWAEAVCALGAKLAAALDYAHRRDVLHRDVKPANVLLTSEGEPLLADFNVGCCSKLDGAGPAAFFGGSLAYMSAEHLEAFDPDHDRAPESLDGRADLFGLAVTLWELRTGERPFGTEALPVGWGGVLGVLAARRRFGPTPEAVAAFPESDVTGLRSTLLACLDPDPDKRPATAAEVNRELELCLRPATRELVRPTPNRWRDLVLRHPVMSLLPVGLAPNLLASVFNISYNRAEIVEHWQPGALAVFDQLILLVNAVLFPVGILIYAVAVHIVGTGVKRLRAGESLDRDDLAARRRRCLRLGGIVAAMCVGCWMVAGLVFPVTLRILTGPPEDATAYVHFVVSLVICGLIAAAYPYFLVTYLAVRVLYPALLGPDGPTAADTPMLRRVERELARYRAAAAAVPLVAVALLASRGVSYPFAVATVSVAGLAGTLLAYVLEGRTRAALAALSDVPVTS